MCVICESWKNGKMTDNEAWRALGELIRANGEYSEENDHFLEVSDQIMAKQDDENSETD